MKYTGLRVKGPTNVDLPLRGVTSATPYLLKSADGLGPPEVAVSIAPTISQGGKYLGRQPLLRELVLRVGLQPAWNTGQTPAELRDELYGLMTPEYGLPLKAQVMNEEAVVAEVQCHVKRIEPVIFSNEPEVQVVLSCFHHHLFAPEIKYQQPAMTTEGGYTYIEIESEGTAPSGFWLAIAFPEGHTGTFQLRDAHPFGEGISINDVFGVNDKLLIDTRPGQRGIWKIDSGETEAVSILDELLPTSDWMQLHRGSNVIRVNNDTIAWGYTLSVGHTPAYWGV